MTLTEAQKRANAKCARDKVKQVGVKFYPADEGLYEWLKSRDNVQGYIKDPIRADMEARRGA